MKRVPGNEPVRFALVGAGRIAVTHLDAFGLTPEAKLTCVIEPREAAGQAVAEQHKARWFKDFKNPEVLALADAAVICTPPNVHQEIARHFLEQGKHVLCEKPLTVSSREARELLALADKEDLLLMMASKFRYVDDLIKAKAILETGILGSIVLFENSFCGKVNMKDRWNAKREVAGGGVLIDNGTHSIDIARYLLGPLAEVQAQNGIAAQGLEVEDTVRLQFRTQRGVIGMVDLSWSINKESDSYVAVFGSEGTLAVGWKGSRYRQDGSAKWVPFGAGYDKNVALARQLQNFIGVVRGREQPLITGDDALASVKVIEAAYLSSSQNLWQPVEAR